MLVNGKMYWGKILGAPQPTKFSPGQWSFELSIDKETQEMLKKAGVKKSYFKDKEDERGIVLEFKREGTKKDGNPAKPFKVVDAQNNPWPKDILIGNGSEVNVMVTLNEREYQGTKILKPAALAIQVWNHVEYKGNGDNFPTKASSEGAEAETW